MKQTNNYHLKKFIPASGLALIVLLTQLAASSAFATIYYWDNNGTASGFGTAAGTWATPTTGDATQGWSTDSTGVAGPGSSVAITSNDQVNFGAGTTGLGAGTITVSGSVSSSNIVFAAGSGAITLASDPLAGGTNLLPATASIIVNNTSDTISTVLAGAGFRLTAGGSGTLFLSSTNTFGGQIIVCNGSGNVTLLANSIDNVNAATGTSLGQPTNAAKGLIQLGTGGNAGTLVFNGLSANQSTDRQIQIGASANGIGGASIVNNDPTYSVIFSNPSFNVAATNLTSSVRSLTLQGSSTGNNTIQGTIADNWFSGGTPSALSIIKNGTGTWILAGTNTYSGNVTIFNGILSVNSFNYVSSGDWALHATGSSLGVPADVSHGAISLGNNAVPGQLTYTGNGETTDRVIRMAGTTGGVKISQSGSGLLKFTSDFSAAGAGSKVLYLLGSTPGTGEIAGAITDNSSANKTALNKSGSGAWKLSGANTFGGNTTISSGTLNVTSIADSGTSAMGLGTLFILGNGTSDGGLIYTGSGNTTSRSLQLGTTSPGTGGGSIINNGSGPLIFTATNFNKPATNTTDSRILTLGGSYTGSVNEIQGSIADNVSGIALVNLTKVDAGSWKLSGTNTYTGNTTINAGTLEIVVASLATNSTVSVAAGGVLQLDFAETNVVAGFVTNGVSLAAGVYGADNVSPYIAGSGRLQVVPAPSGPTLTSASPNPVVGSSYPVNLTLNGSGFTGATAVLLTNLTVASGASYVPTVNSDSSITVSFVPGTAAATWNATVVNGSPSAQTGFTVTMPMAVTINPGNLNSAGKGKLVLSGTGGAPGASYAVLTTPSLNSPIVWTPMATNTFANDSSFSFTNTVNLATNQLFLRIEL